MDYPRLASELLRALRARRSQTAFSRRLGYAANVAYAWESGRRFPAARALFRAGIQNRIAPETLRSFAPGMPAAARGARSSWGAADTAAFLRALAGDAALVHVARAVGVDRATAT